jgi:hypothetical protein
MLVVNAPAPAPVVCTLNATLTPDCSRWRPAAAAVTPVMVMLDAATPSAPATAVLKPAASVVPKVAVV